MKEITIEIYKSTLPPTYEDIERLIKLKIEIDPNSVIGDEFGYPIPNAISSYDQGKIERSSGYHRFSRLKEGPNDVTMITNSSNEGFIKGYELVQVCIFIKKVC